MEKKNYIPFYMTYPVNYPFKEENKVAKDMDYLRELHPAEAKRLTKRISAILDKLDYEGSMIYDEYPDRWQLYRLAESIVKILKEEETKEVSPEKWEWISDMVQVLLYDEIFHRRNGGKNEKNKSRVYVDHKNWKSPYNKV